jgi:hypothetical protein
LHAEFSLQKGLQFVEQVVGLQQRRVSRFALQGGGGACTKADEITHDNHSHQCARLDPVKKALFTNWLTKFSHLGL